jgi:hypothetical protein
LAEKNTLTNIQNTFNIRDLISSTDTNFYNKNNEQVQVNEPENEAIDDENKVDYDNISDISEEYTEDSSFYNDEVVHNETFYDDDEDETQKQTRDQVDEPDNEAVDMFVSDNENPVFTPVKTEPDTLRFASSKTSEPEPKKVVPTPQSKKKKMYPLNT